MLIIYSLIAALSGFLMSIGVHYKQGEIGALGILMLAAVIGSIFLIGF